MKTTRGVYVSLYRHLIDPYHYSFHSSVATSAGIATAHVTETDGMRKCCMSDVLIVAVASTEVPRCCLHSSLLLPPALLCAYQLPARARCRAAMPGDRQQILKPRLSSSLLLSSFPPTSTSINWQHIPHLYQLPPQLHTQPARSPVRTAIMHHTLSLVALAAMAQAACPTKPLW